MGDVIGAHLDTREALSKLRAKREHIARGRRIDRARVSAICRIESSIDDLNSTLVALGYGPSTPGLRRDALEFITKLETRVRNLVHNEIDGCARIADLNL